MLFRVDGPAAGRVENKERALPQAGVYETFQPDHRTQRMVSPVSPEHQTIKFLDSSRYGVGCD